MSTKDPGHESTEDADFLATYDPASYPRLAVAVDVALMTVHEGELRVLLLERDEQPQKGRWALPGGFVAPDEDLPDAAARVLATKAGLRNVFLEQLFTFGAPDRDPRMRVISVTYYALVDHARLASLEGHQIAKVSSAGAELAVQDRDGAELKLAFDHKQILELVVERLRGKLDYAALGFQLLPAHFTLRQLQTVHEVVLGRPLNKDSFRRRMLASGRIEPTGEREENVLHRPAELYTLANQSAV